MGGAIYMLGDASAVITDSTFTKNIGEKTGGAIMAESFSFLNISSGCSFNLNDATNETGDSIYATGSSGYIALTDSTFKQMQSSQFLYLYDITKI